VNGIRVARPIGVAGHNLDAILFLFDLDNLAILHNLGGCQTLFLAFVMPIVSADDGAGESYKGFTEARNTSGNFLSRLCDVLRIFFLVASRPATKVEAGES
jgi:hypothetical protein